MRPVGAFGHRVIPSASSMYGGLDPSGFRACGAKFYFAILQNKWLPAPSFLRMIPPNLPQIPLPPRPPASKGGQFLNGAYLQKSRVLKVQSERSNTPRRAAARKKAFL